MKPDKSEKPKRKAELGPPEPSVKRPRADSASSTSQKAPPEIPFGINPSPNAITLAKGLHGEPFYKWVNLRAVELFQQIEVDYPDLPKLTRLVL